MPNDPRCPSRRELLSLLAAGALVNTAPVRSQSKHPWGVQLYTVRDLLGDRAAETLQAIAAIGYKELEILRGDLERVVPLARDLGLSPVSVHIEAPLVTGDWAHWRPPGAPARKDLTLQRALEQVRASGARYAVVAYLMPGERGKDAAWYQRFADTMNRAGEDAKAAGITLAYHNHGFEFEKLPGGRPLDVLAERLDPALVTLEIDVFWVSITGADPVSVLGQFARRVSLVHLKDKARGAPAETDESKVARATFVEVGSGSLDFGAIVKAAEAAGVRHFFVEQDYTPGDPLASLRKSYAHLQQLA
jgi:sugar phosphate isomerase/epimerase